MEKRILFREIAEERLYKVLQLVILDENDLEIDCTDFGEEYKERTNSEELNSIPIEEAIDKLKGYQDEIQEIIDNYKEMYL